MPCVGNSGAAALNATVLDNNATTAALNGGCRGNASRGEGLAEGSAERLTHGGAGSVPPAAVIVAAVAGGLLALCLIACAARHLLKRKKGKGGADSTKAARRPGKTPAAPWAAHSHSMVEISISEMGSTSSSSRPPPPPADAMPTMANPRASAMPGAASPDRKNRGTVACKPLSQGPEVKAAPQWLIDAMRTESDPL